MHQKISSILRIQRLILPTMHPALMQSKTTVPSASSRKSLWTVTNKNIFTTSTTHRLEIPRTFSISHVHDTSNVFDESILDVVVCPLSKQPLRYDKETNELVNDDIGVAYPIEDGIPNLVPQDARIIKDNNDSKKDTDENSSVNKT